MRIFKITNPTKIPITEKILSTNEDGGHIVRTKLIMRPKSSMLVDEARGGKMIREFDFLTNEVYELPYVEIYNPSEETIKVYPYGAEKEIISKTSIVLDSQMGALILKTYHFLVGKEHKVKRKAAKKTVKKKMTKPVKITVKRIAKPKIKVVKKKK